MAKKDDSTQIAAILSYLVVGIIWYFVDEKVKKSKLAQYHVKQAIVFIIAAVIWHVVWSVATFILTIISFGLLTGLASLGFAVPLVFAIIGMINAGNEKQKPLPIIGQYAKNLKF